MEGNKLEAPEPVRGGLESTARSPPHSPLSVPVGKVMFRILCYVSRLGSVIGKRGKVIKQLKESTKSSILVEKAPSDPTYCYIRIVGDVGSTSWVKLGAQEEEVIEVSRAQYALIRVFEVVNGYQTAGTVSCRLLMEARYVGEVIGILIDKIRKETGSSVDIIQDDLPRFADPDDVMVKIEGNVMAVKKALVSISSCLQACQPLKATQETCSQPRIYSLSQRTSASEYHPVTIKQQPLRVVLKILCSNERASCVIGQERNTIIAAIKSETGVSISVGDTLADCDERLITLSENLKDRNSQSQAQREIVLVFSRLYETATENDNITARLVVPSNQIGGLVGKSSHRISEMQELSGAFIQVLKVVQNPKCVADNNQVVQISGKFPNVKEAINHVTIKLVKNFISGSFHVTSRPVDADPCIRPQYPFPNMFTPTSGYPPNFVQYPFPIMFTPTVGYAPNFGQYPFPNMFTPTAGYAPNFGRPPSMDLNDIYRHSSQTPFWSQIPAAPRGVYDGSGGLPSTMANLRLDSRLMISSNDTNTTVEFRVPAENAVDFVFGHNFLENLRELSGARIRALESDRILVISGTPHQIQSVRSILHILTLV